MQHEIKENKGNKYLKYIVTTGFLFSFIKVLASTAVAILAIN